MNIPYLAKLAQTRPALARALETALAAALSYILGAMAEWNAISLQGLIMATTMPLYMAATKYRREMEKLNSGK